MAAVQHRCASACLPRPRSALASSVSIGASCSITYTALAKYCCCSWHNMHWERCSSPHPDHPKSTLCTAHCYITAHNPYMATSMYVLHYMQQQVSTFIRLLDSIVSAGMFHGFFIIRAGRVSATDPSVREANGFAFIGHLQASRKSSTISSRSRTFPF